LKNLSNILVNIAQGRAPALPGIKYAAAGAPARANKSEVTVYQKGSNFPLSKGLNNDLP